VDLAEGAKMVWNYMLGNVVYQRCVLKFCKRQNKNTRTLSAKKNQTPTLYIYSLKFYTVGFNFQLHIHI